MVKARVGAKRERRKGGQCARPYEVEPSMYLGGDVKIWEGIFLLLTSLCEGLMELSVGKCLLGVISGVAE